MRDDDGSCAAEAGGRARYRQRLVDECAGKWRVQRWGRGGFAVGWSLLHMAEFSRSAHVLGGHIQPCGGACIVMHWRQCDSAMVKVAAGAQAASSIEWEMAMFVCVCFVTD